MTITAQDIRDLVDRGIPVYWSHEGYQVLKDSIGQYDIVCLRNDNRIGLTWMDGVTLNGQPEEFFAVDALDVWLRIFDGEEDEIADAEANTYFDHGTYRVDWYLNSVGLVTSVHFDTHDEAREWLTAQGFGDFTT